MASNAQMLSKPAVSIRCAASARLRAPGAGALRPPAGKLSPKRVMALLSVPHAKICQSEEKDEPSCASMTADGIERKGARHAFRDLHEHGQHDVGQRAGPLAAPRGNP